MYQIFHGRPRRAIAALRKSVCFSLVLAFSCFSAAKQPLGLPENSEIEAEHDVALSALGEMLFADPRLSANGSMSCATCHRPDNHFTDSKPVAIGVKGQPGTRNTPSLLNIAYVSQLLWDGRRKTLEEQARDPLVNPNEHALSGDAQLVAVVTGDEHYRHEFQRLFGKGPEAVNAGNIARAIAAYERQLRSGDSPFDLYFYGADSEAITGSAARGFEIFRGRGGCSVCHVIGDKYALFTDGNFHNSPIPLAATTTSRLSRVVAEVNALGELSNPDALGALISSDADVAALGRYLATRDPQDIGKFRTPALRNIAQTAPYMHDGSVATLEAAIEIELYGLRNGSRYPVILTPEEKADLAEFLRSLTGAVPAAPKPTAQR